MALAIMKDAVKIGGIRLARLVNVRYDRFSRDPGSVRPHKFMPTLSKRNRDFAGFSLIELAVVLVIIGLLATTALNVTGVYLSKQRRDTTLARLALIESSLSLFVAQNKYLPCPAVGTLDSTAASPDANLGKERVSYSGSVRVKCSLTTAPGAAWNQDTGILPWATLGLSITDAQDGWGNMFTYRVEESLIAADRMDFTMCTPAGSNPTPVGTSPALTCSTCSTATFPGACNAPKVVTAGRGLRVKSVGGSILADPNPATGVSTGAAYVVISAGENQDHSYQVTGVLTSGTPASGTQEMQNYADTGYPANSATAYFVDDVTNFATTTAHFDDFVLRPSILAVATKAQLGSRAY